LEKNLLLTVSEIAKELRVSKATVCKILREKTLKSIKVQGRYRVDIEDFERYKKGGN